MVYTLFGISAVWYCYALGALLAGSITTAALVSLSRRRSPGILQRTIVFVGAVIAGYVFFSVGGAFEVPMVRGPSYYRGVAYALGLLAGLITPPAIDLIWEIGRRCMVFAAREIKKPFNRQN